MENIIISNPLRLDKIKKSFQSLQPSQIQVISDFDRTLTTNFINGHRAPSLIGLLREGNFLTADYADKAQSLANYYRPIEIDPLISLAEKREAMATWWRKHFNLLISSGLKKSDINQAIQQRSLQLREGFHELFNFLQHKDIPLIIFSATGLGQEGIQFLLRREKLRGNNIYLVANSFIWDEEGRAVKVNEPIIHSFNKNETILQDFSFFSKIKDRNNIILLGDTLSDIDMVQGSNCNNLLKIGFLNEEVEHNLAAFQEAYDVIILHDGSLEFVNNIFREIIL